jgi:hypothetical protein
MDALKFHAKKSVKYLAAADTQYWNVQRLVEGDSEPSLVKLPVFGFFNENGEPFVERLFAFGYWRLQFHGVRMQLEVLFPLAQQIENSHAQLSGQVDILEGISRRLHELRIRRTTNSLTLQALAEELRGGLKILENNRDKMVEKRREI